MIKQLVIVFLFLAGLSGITKAQCIDPLSITPSYPCNDPDYRPVCGCDGNTYRHMCDARYRNGVLFWTDGPCSGFEFDLIPTFVTDNDIVKFTFYQNTGNIARCFVLDYFGKVMIDRTLRASDNFAFPADYFEIDPVGFRPGPYIVIVYNSKGTYRYKKFVKI